ncbi:hypothetical protein L798_07105 [Zootermopsis nevadensis]|uniref:Uncharacterized protein n=1 Tax=Zootermopsis nevadensis TaxID=136037 RepID=A0A067RTN1_ZOONE|nr:hypothetical protein L798_07105 [Zootermopsis nevadensis]
MGEERTGVRADTVGEPMGEGEPQKDHMEDRISKFSTTGALPTGPLRSLERFQIYLINYHTKCQPTESMPEMLVSIYQTAIFTYTLISFLVLSSSKNKSPI